MPIVAEAAAVYSIAAAAAAVYIYVVPAIVIVVGVPLCCCVFIVIVFSLSNVVDCYSAVFGIVSCSPTPVAGIGHLFSFVLSSSFSFVVSFVSFVAFSSKRIAVSNWVVVGVVSFPSILSFSFVVIVVAVAVVSTVAFAFMFSFAFTFSFVFSFSFVHCVNVHGCLSSSIVGWHAGWLCGELL